MQFPWTLIKGEELISKRPNVKLKTGLLPNSPPKLKTPIPSELGYRGLESLIFSIISMPIIEKKELFGIKSLLLIQNSVFLINPSSS